MISQLPELTIVSSFRIVSSLLRYVVWPFCFVKLARRIACNVIYSVLFKLLSLTDRVPNSDSFLWVVADIKNAVNNEELVLNTVATLNNLSFYNDDDSVVQQRQVEITESKLDAAGSTALYLLTLEPPPPPPPYR